jgi:hypothetical protein
VAHWTADVWPRDAPGFRVDRLLDAARDVRKGHSKLLARLQGGGVRGKCLGETPRSDYRRREVCI